MSTCTYVPNVSLRPGFSWDYGAAEAASVGISEPADKQTTRFSCPHDAHVNYFSGRFALVGLATGHGPRSSQAARLAIQQLRHQLTTVLPKHGNGDEPSLSALKASLTACDESLLQHESACCNDSGAAATVLWIGHQSKNCVVCNVGDVRTVVARGDDLGSSLESVQLTTDSTPATAKERVRLESAGATILRRPCDWPTSASSSSYDVVVNDKSAPTGHLTRCLGSASARKFGVSSKPHGCSYSLHARDEFLVVASGSVWQVLTEQECIEFVHRYSQDRDSGLSVADALTLEAQQRWKRQVIQGDVPALSCFIIFLRPPFCMNSVIQIRNAPAAARSSEEAAMLCELWSKDPTTNPALQLPFSFFSYLYEDMHSSLYNRPENLRSRLTAALLAASNDSVSRDQLKSSSAQAGQDPALQESYEAHPTMLLCKVRPVGPAVDDGDHGADPTAPSASNVSPRLPPKRPSGQLSTSQRVSWAALPGDENGPSFSEHGDLPARQESELATDSIDSQPPEAAADGCAFQFASVQPQPVSSFSGVELSGLESQVEQSLSSMGTGLSRDSVPTPQQSPFALPLWRTHSGFSCLSVEGSQERNKLGALADVCVHGSSASLASMSHVRGPLRSTTASGICQLSAYDSMFDQSDRCVRGGRLKYSKSMGALAASQAVPAGGTRAPLTSLSLSAPVPVKALAAEDAGNDLEGAVHAGRRKYSGALSVQVSALSGALSLESDLAAYAAASISPTSTVLTPAGGNSDQVVSRRWVTMAPGAPCAADVAPGAVYTRVLDAAAPVGDEDLQPHYQACHADAGVGTALRRSTERNAPAPSTHTVVGYVTNALGHVSRTLALQATTGHTPCQPGCHTCSSASGSSGQVLSVYADAAEAEDSALAPCTPTSCNSTEHAGSTLYGCALPDGPAASFRAALPSLAEAGA